MTIDQIGFVNSKEIINALEQLPAKVQRKNLLDVFKAAVKIWADEAKRRAPVSTGQLRDAIKAVRGRMRNGLVGAAVVIKGGTGLTGEEAARLAIKANAQEYGWMNRGSRDSSHKKRGETNAERHNPGHPFMRPAFEAKKEEVAKNVENALNEIVAQVWEHE